MGRPPHRTPAVVLSPVQPVPPARADAPVSQPQYDHRKTGEVAIRLPCLGICALLVAVLVIACDEATSPAAIGVPVTVTLTGTWFGSASDSHRTAQQLTLRLTQDGRDVTGSVTGTWLTPYRSTPRGR